MKIQPVKYHFQYSNGQIKVINDIKLSTYISYTELNYRYSSNSIYYMFIKNENIFGIKIRKKFF